MDPLIGARVICVVMEMNQTETGIKVPEALKQYMPEMYKWVQEKYILLSLSSSLFISPPPLSLSLSLSFFIYLSIFIIYLISFK